jgi:hypothetical protein
VSVIAVVFLEKKKKVGRALCDPWATTLSAHQFQPHQTLTKKPARRSPNLEVARRGERREEGSKEEEAEGERVGREEDEGPRVGEADVRVLQGGEAPGHRLYPLHRQPQAQAAPGLLHPRRSRRIMHPPAAAIAAACQQHRLRRSVHRVRRPPSLPQFFFFLLVPVLLSSSSCVSHVLLITGRIRFPFRVEGRICSGI